MKSKSFAAVAAVAGMATIAAAQSLPSLAPAPETADNGTIKTVAFDLPFSSFASQEARKAYVQRQRNPYPLVRDIARTRQLADEKTAPLLADMRARYPTQSTKGKIAGVPVETFIPSTGVAPQNKGKVLISLHGGGFVTGGGGIGGAMEAIPIAGEGRIKVIAVDYRLAPENRFPAASDDVVAVYRELLKTHRPENIGLYGCSAGGMLSAQAVARFQVEKLPRPGAVGVFCASLYSFGEGDSAQLWPRMGSVIRIVPPAVPETTFGMASPYLAGNSTSNPLIRPAASEAVLRAFPPTLFLTGTRAPEMSGAAQSHLELRALGVKSELYLFDGQDHGFYVDLSIPESRRATMLIARFFNENLGRRK